MRTTGHITPTPTTTSPPPTPIPTMLSLSNSWIASCFESLVGLRPFLIPPQDLIDMRDIATIPNVDLGLISPRSRGMFLDTNRSTMCPFSSQGEQICEYSAPCPRPGLWETRDQWQLVGNRPLSIAERF